MRETSTSQTFQKKVKKVLDKLHKVWYNKNVKRETSYRIKRVASYRKKEIDTMAKMTKRDYFNSLLNIAEVSANADLTAFIQHELELLAKKNSSEKKPTAVQVANESVKQAILEGLDGAEDGKTITEMLNTIPALEGMQNQKVSALLRQMIADGKVERLEIKRKAYFRKVEG